MSALVAIITRTKNRPLLLKRAAESVAGQKFDDYIWVVVNDGGDQSEVRRVLDTCPVDQMRIKLFSNPISLGMEAASNIGIRQTNSKYILIHDDDDTLHPDFLGETVRFLESAVGHKYGGVSTKVDYVSEEICENAVIFHEQSPYMDWVQTVDFAEILAQNLITTISFLYRRELFDQIGGYNEELPVLGDWFFNVEFVLRADIKILSKTLAYYHHRDHNDGGRGQAYSNSVIGGLSDHIENATRCRNALIRKYRHEGGVVGAVVSGYFAHVQRQPLHRYQQGYSTRTHAGMSFNSDQLELDRLWLLSHLLAKKTKQSWISRKKISLADNGLTLGELARLAIKHKLQFSPPIGFDETRYLKSNPDVAEEVRKGGFRSGYEHFVLHGHFEERERPSL